MKTLSSPTIESRHDPMLETTKQITGVPMILLQSYISLSSDYQKFSYASLKAMNQYKEAKAHELILSQFLWSCLLLIVVKTSKRKLVPSGSNLMSLVSCWTLVLTNYKHRRSNPHRLAPPLSRIARGSLIKILEPSKLSPVVGDASTSKPLCHLTFNHQRVILLPTPQA